MFHVIKIDGKPSQEYINSRLRPGKKRFGRAKTENAAKVLEAYLPEHLHPHQVRHELLYEVYTVIDDPAHDPSSSFTRRVETNFDRPTIGYATRMTNLGGELLYRQDDESVSPVDTGELFMVIYKRTLPL